MTLLMPEFSLAAYWDRWYIQHWIKGVSAGFTGPFGPKEAQTTLDAFLSGKFSAFAYHWEEHPRDLK